MKAILTALILAAPTFAAADIFTIETNNWDVRKRLTWTGKLVEMDADTGIARFEFVGRKGRESVEVHYSRIYSITFDAQIRTPKTFPRTRADLRTPLANITRKRERVELTNDGFLGDDIPDQIKVVPNREAPAYTLRGGLAEMNQGATGIIALGPDRSEVSFDVDAEALRSWIRGR